MGSGKGEEVEEVVHYPRADILETIDDVLDTLLDQEGLEVDPVDRLEGDTPLHKAVRYVNDREADEWEKAAPLVELLVEAGADPR